MENVRVTELKKIDKNAKISQDLLWARSDTDEGFQLYNWDGERWFMYSRVKYGKEYIATEKRVTVGKAKRVVYRGPRGGEYVKINKKYVSVKSL